MVRWYIYIDMTPWPAEKKSIVFYNNMTFLNFWSTINFQRHNKFCSTLWLPMSWIMLKHQNPISLIKTVFPGMGFPLYIGQSWDHLIFVMGSHILVKWCLYIETVPRLSPCMILTQYILFQSSANSTWILKFFVIYYKHAIHYPCVEPCY